MKYRHYAPKASMVLVEGAQDKVIAYIKEEAKKKREQGLRIGIMATDESKELYKACRLYTSHALDLSENKVQLP